MSAPGTRKPTTTASTGAYRKRIPDKPGKYRAKALKTYVNRGFGACLQAISQVPTTG